MKKNNFNADITDAMAEMGDFSQIMVIALYGASKSYNQDDIKFTVDYVLRHKGELSTLDKVDARSIAACSDGPIWQELIDGLS